MTTIGTPFTLTKFTGKFLSPLTLTSIPVTQNWFKESYTVCWLKETLWAPLLSIYTSPALSGQNSSHCRRLHHSDSNSAVTTFALEESIQHFNFCINNLFLALFPHKYKSVLFMLQPFNPIVAKIHFKDGYFDRLLSFKYLGNFLDSKLWWKFDIYTIVLLSSSISDWMGWRPNYPVDIP